MCWVGNDLKAVEERLAKGDVAAVIMEPANVQHRRHRARPGYLEGVRAALLKKQERF